VINGSLQEAGDVKAMAKTTVGSDVIDGSLQEAGDVKAMAKATVGSDVIDGSLQEAGESDETGGRKRKMTTRCQSEK
jgi:hypothetical protein